MTVGNCIVAGKEFSHASGCRMDGRIHSNRSERKGCSGGFWKRVHSEAIGPGGISEGRGDLVLSEDGGWING